MVKDAAKLPSNPGQRTIEDAMRGDGIAYRPPRKKVHITAEDAKIRLKVAKQWVKKPRSFWRKNVRAYMDVKNWPAPLTEGQREKYRQTRIRGHLRTKAEGTEQGFTKPRSEHSWIGIPSIAISAAIAKDRVILWHAHDTRWNGGTAAALYKGPLLQALRRTWGPQKKYLIVEDGDRKGYQSGKGKAAKAEAGIRALTLPPRSPSLMPLDYAVWTEVEKTMMKTEPKKGTETKAQFIERLKKAATSLKRGFVSGTIDQFQDRLKGIIEAKGYHPKMD